MKIEITLRNGSESNTKEFGSFDKAIKYLEDKKPVNSLVDKRAEYLSS